MPTIRQLFDNREGAIYFIADKAQEAGLSKIGGAAPLHFESFNDFNLKEYYYLLTLQDSLLDPIIGNNALSIFISKRFSPFKEKTQYPDLDIRCVIHPPTAYGAGNVDSAADIIETNLKAIEGANDVEVYIAKMGGEMEWVQHEPSDENLLLDNGYAYFLKVDDNGMNDTILDGDYVFGYGALYVYAKISESRVHDFVAGFTQF